MQYSEHPLEDFYRALIDNDENLFKKIHIPHSSVFYAREAYYHYSGERISLQRMEEAMVAEGMLSPEQGI